MLPRRDAIVSVVAGRDAEPVEVERMHRGDRLGLDVVERRRAARHRPGVPVLELTAGDEHHRVLGVGALGGGDRIRRHELAAALAVGKFSMKTTGSPGSPSFTHG